MAETIAQLRLKTACMLIDAWNRCGATYAVLHGLDDYPERVGRDLDILVPDNDVDRFLDTSRRLFQSEGWEYVMEPSNLWGRRIVAVRWVADRLVYMEIHTMSALRWRWVQLAANFAPVAAEGGFLTDPWARFTKRVLLPALAGDLRRFQKEPVAPTALERSGVQAELQRLLPSALFKATWACLNANDLERLHTLLPKIRHSLLLAYMLRRPVPAILGLARIVKRETMRFFDRSGLKVAIVGPDGVGKSTVIQHLADLLSPVFLDCVIRHWRPGLLPALGSFRQTTGRNASSEPIRTEAGSGFLLRLLYYTLDYAVGHYVKDARVLSRQGLVLYDRSPWDMSVHPIRFGLSRPAPDCWTRWLSGRYDLVILLADEAGKIVKRKPELSEPEIEQQYHRWAQFEAVGAIERQDVLEDPVATARAVAVQVLTHWAAEA